MPQKVYTDIFFDLDHTLWDFNKNSHETLLELYHDFKLQELGVPTFQDFHEVYYKINDQKWTLYREHKITKTELRTTRFKDTLLNFEIENPEMAITLDQDYLKRSPYKTNLFPNTHKVLSYLHKKYNLHIITNGFTEVQEIKMNSTQLTPYFNHKITSDDVGVNKPDPKIFTHALRLAGAHRNKSIMIGDNLIADIIGARNVGMDQVFFNPEKAKHDINVTHEISDLGQLLKLL